MVKIGLQIKASLENVNNLRPDDEAFKWFLKVKCTSCGEEAPNWIYVSQTEVFSLKNSRGDANLIMKCKLCSRDNCMSIIKDSLKPYMVDDSNEFKTIVAFDCRGLEPVDFDPRSGYVIEGAESGTRFENVEFQGGEWVDYDEKAKESVSVFELSHRFIKL